MNTFWNATTISSLDYGGRFKTKDKTICSGALKANFFRRYQVSYWDADHFPAPALVSVKADSKAVWF